MHDENHLMTIYISHQKQYRIRLKRKVKECNSEF